MMMLKSPWTSEGFGLEIAMLWLEVTREIEKRMRECVERRRHDDDNDVVRRELNGMNDESVRLDCTFVLSFVCDLTFLFPSLLSTCLFTPVWVLFDLFPSYFFVRQKKETLWLTEKIEKRLSETRAAKKTFLTILRKRKERIVVVRSHPRNGMKLNTQKTHSFLCVISMTKIYQQKLRKKERSFDWMKRKTWKEWRTRKRSWQWEKGNRKWSLHLTCMAISRPLNVIRRMGSTIFLLSLIYCSWQFIPKWPAWVTRHSSKVSSTGHTQSEKEERKELKHEIYVTDSCSYHDPQ